MKAPAGTGSGFTFKARAMTALVALMAASSFACHIGNYVWVDADLDGIQDETGTGLGSVTVRLLNSSGTVIGTTTTDSTGLYEFAVDANRNYSVQFVLPSGYAFTLRDQGTNNAKDSDANVADGKTIQTYISDGEYDDTWDCGLVKLLDYGDLPDTGAGTGVGNYQTRLSDSGPRHTYTATGPWLGATCDGEANGQPNAGGTGDDAAGSDDEDGVTIPSLIPGQSATLVINVTKASGKLNAWIDWNGDGDFSDAGETIANNTAVGLGNNNLVVSVPANAKTGASLGARFRVSKSGGLASTGAATNGEVEDYIVTCSSPLASIGDYVWLDTDKDGIQDGTESGLANITVRLYTSANPGVPYNTTTTSGTGYYAFTGLAVGSYFVEFVLPGATYVFTSQNQGVNDAADSDADTTTGRTIATALTAGENDVTWDCGMHVGTTLVTLTDFGGEVRDGQLVVSWTTSSEQGSVGFFLKRLDPASGSYVAVTPSLVPAALSSGDEQVYDVVDTGASIPGDNQYLLVEVENTGRRNEYGPFTVSVAPAAVVSPALATAPEVGRLTAEPGSLVLRWSSVAGATYAIERGTTANGPFEAVASGIAATAPENVATVVDNAAGAFYRVVQE